MPYLPLDHPDPFAATVGIMLYPLAEEAREARAFAAHLLAVPLKKFHAAGHKLSYDALGQIAEDGVFLTKDFERRIWQGSATGELFKVYYALCCSNPELASWNHAIKVANSVASSEQARGGRTYRRDTKSGFITVAHLWAAWSIRGRQFATDPSVGYNGYEDFQSFLAETEILRDWGQYWRPNRAKSPTPLPAEVWRVLEGWIPPQCQEAWPPTGRVPILELAPSLLKGIRPAGRPRR